MYNCVYICVMGLEEIRKLKEQAGLPKPPKQYTIPKKSKKKLEQEAKEKEERGGGDTELQRFFKSAMRRMSGFCAETGLKTETKIYKYAICSICHILPRSKCPSVATHPCIWIELDVGFHVKFDAMSWEEREKLGCWPIIRDKLIMVYPDLAPEERRHFPASVLKYMEEHENF